ncbi:MAG: hybrid sensor histidine kinase/response regulator [Deltaproteobacteria bacterium]|nr:MAG: hybrid sensor histidine kinase/response regulator [Deltaproteobacteria bacterium]
MFFEDDETLQMYVEESLDHLADIETDLLAMEEQGEEIDEELVNNVFRAAHSVKGGAGFMGLDVIKELSHNLENILGLIREKKLPPTSSIISILLKSFDRLKELMENVETSNDQDIDEFIKDLKGITEDDVPESEENGENSVSMSFEPADFVENNKKEVDKAVKQGKFIYIIEYDLIKDVQNRNKKLAEIIENLSKSGAIIDCRLDISSFGTLETYNPLKMPFFILFGSIIEPDMVSVLVDIDPDFIFHISEDSLALQSENKDVKDNFDVEEKTEKKDENIKENETVVENKKSEKTEPGLKKQVKSLKPQEDTSKKPPASSLRINVNLLDNLMTLAGELVLSRNQLMQGLNSSNQYNIESASQRIDMITSELQEAIMQTRMQPISNVFNKFTRVVRDLSKSLGKEIALNLEGKEVELDKTIIEAINDPLTHLVRNSVDHGIETPRERELAGKKPEGTINLKAYHEAGQVNIEIEDDGGGIDPEKISSIAIQKGVVTEQDAALLSKKDKMNLIFAPGFSTAEEITDVSGRGVGMDVVKSNLEKLGGIIDIESKVGKGTSIKIKLPLTLAIIPSQIISSGGEKYAIPQVNLDELLRIPASRIKEKIETVGDASVVRLRGILLPLIELASVLGIEKTYIDPETGLEKEDRRENIADRRSKDLLESFAPDSDNSKMKERQLNDRRYRASSAINIAVVSAGTFRYGLVVDELKDSEEIVVKPLGKHLKNCRGYAGATIMGDGKVALILDVAALAEMGNLARSSSSKKIAEEKEKMDISSDKLKDHASLLLFRNSREEQFAVPLNLVQRIERIKMTDIEVVGGQRVIQYRGGSLPLHELGEGTTVQPLAESEQIEVIVFQITGREVGLMVSPPVDAVDVVLNVDPETLKQPGIMGSLIINDFTTLMVDVYEFFKILHPEWYSEKDSLNLIDSETGEPGNIKILFAEDSSFFRNQVKGFLEEDGFNVTSAEDGEAAWDIISSEKDNFDIILTDLEMPRMDGFQLTSKIKKDNRFSHKPVIALTSLAGEEDIAKGQAVGIDEYLVKLDREKLVMSIRSYIK